MIWSAPILRSSSGFSEMNMRAVLVVVPPPPPEKAFTVSMAGSASMMFTIVSRVLSMAWNEVS